MSHEEIGRRYPAAIKTTARFDAKAVRGTLIRRGGPDERGFLRYAYRPFDNRWLYWEADTKLLDEKRADYRPHVFDGNPWIEAREREAKEAFSRGTLVQHLADNFGNGLSNFFPLWLSDDGFAVGATTGRRPNVSSAAQRYLRRVGATVEDLFHHVLAVLQDPVYREANAGALRIEWPRIPLPAWSDGTAGTAGTTPASAEETTKMRTTAGAAPMLAESAARGRELVRLLDPDTPVPGVTVGALRPEIAVIAVPSTVDGRNMTADDFAIAAGWGHFGRGDAVMPGQGRTVERVCTPVERTAVSDAMPALGECRSTST